MMNVLFFMIGLMLGGFFGVITMCLFQINLDRKEDRKKDRKKEGVLDGIDD